MTEPDFLDLLLGVWRADIESVEFPTFADLLIPPPRQNQHMPSEPGGNQ
ncbi:hypothetical protein ACFWMR_02260 [Amycolatopsis thailandensis]